MRLSRKIQNIIPRAYTFSPFLDYELGVSTYFDVFWIGLLNTILVSLLGIIGASILGVSLII